ncbi:LPXTG cell wall anchor domain-containing protein [Bacillus mobilis]|uniref:Cell surface protein n=2 Tax=Bacillus cereus group TaxID=86661 RepID=A0A1C4F6Z8_BACCE|nr:MULTISPECIES: LPXTG cell wall anchor domain-containing protein [Bacillus cereus group]MCC2461792.1 LPXTG cell wall anchor domain-containing protein [Bacillus mobilis]MCU5432052.1 LPXTG cell wall anchor domain-containing protein [Bacillus mobilis]MCU5591974.1 LPXTG cell wall anchor domain-containing protein [Bacillus mobilis]MCU5735854.1 LPXTG cell wall anchor domain-containing protein [Bacillus mobilis]MCU9559921.1 LPXTG cell wall anchor domain-containing protein [Bacillus mobilis]
MKKKLLPICAMALLTVGYSSVASADTGTVTKEEAAQLQQDKAKKEALIKEQQKSEEEKKRIAQEQLKNDMAKKEAAQVQQKNGAVKKEVAKPVVQGEKLPNTASNNVAMMALSACLVGIGTLFGLNRRNKVKA